MKRDFLKNLDIGNGAHLSDDLVEQIMAEAGKTKTEMQNTIATLTTERDGLKTQLSDANAAIQSYKDMNIEGIKQSAADWETKYNTDTQALKDQLERTKYGYAVENAVGNLKFTSESAKKAFLADLTAKKLPIQESKLLRLEDFAKIDWILISPPHAGRDLQIHFSPSLPCNFNPPSPCGEGRDFNAKRDAAIHFNPPSPCGEGLEPFPDDRDFPCISIHPPHAGRDQSSQLIWMPTPKFQSTLPMRGGTILSE